MSTIYGSLEPVASSWKKNDIKKYELSFYNTNDGVDMGCIRGVEESLGSWRYAKAVDRWTWNTAAAQQVQQTVLD